MVAARRKKSEKIDINTAGLASPEHWEALKRLDADMKKASRLMGKRQARYLVDCYYQIQHIRKASGQQVLQMEKPINEDEVLSEESQELETDKKPRILQFEPSTVHFWIYESMETLERDIKRALDAFVKEYAVGRWMQSIVGIGPVISAGMLANLDIRRSKTAGGFWKFSGLDPTVRWTKGQTRPYNVKMKRLIWIAGDCWVKTKARPNDYYGKIYIARKEFEQQKNDRGEYADLAKYTLTGECPRCKLSAVPRCPVCNGFPKVTPKVWKAVETKKIYESGRLPDGRIHLRCMRHTGKIFLSHLHHVMHEDYYRTPPPVPFVIAKYAEHTHFIPIPNYPHTLGGKSLRDMME